MDNLLDIPDLPDDSAALARAEVEKLRLKVLMYPGDVYYAICLQGWLKELAKLEEQAR